MPEDYPLEMIHLRRLRLGIGRAVLGIAAVAASVPVQAASIPVDRRDSLTNHDLRSHDDAVSLLGNQVAESRALARLARDQGAFAASSFGAGFGGSVWALVEEEAAHGFADRWLAGYRELYPDLARVEAFVTRPGPGVIELH